MGNSGSSSRSSTKIDTRLAVNSLASQVMNCTSSTLVSQSFRLIGNYNNAVVRQVQAVQFSNDCSISAENMTTLQNDIANALQQAAKAQSASLLSVLGGSTSDAISDIRSDVSQNITQSTVQNIVNNSATQQEIFISGNSNIVRVDQSQTLSIVQNNAQQVINKLSSVTRINNALAQTSTAVSSNPVSDILNSIFSGLTDLSSVYAVVFVIVAVVAMAVGGYIVLQGGFLGTLLGNDAGDNFGPPQMAPSDAVDQANADVEI